MKRYVGILAVLGAILVLAVPVGARVLTDRALAETDAQALTPAELDRFLADAKRVTALGVFPEGGTRDAAPLLNKWVKLDGGPDLDAGPDAPAAWTDRALYDAVKCPKHTEAWPACVTDVPTVDLAWMAELPTYDTWDPGASGPWARWLAGNPHAAAMAAPLPNMLVFQTAAKARLLQARARGELPAALGEVRALARLLWSTEGLIPAMVALSLLNLERSAHADAVANSVDVTAFTPVSKDDTEALRRYTFGLVMVYAGEAGPDAVARLEREVPGFPGRCAAVTEAMAQVGMLRDAFDGRWPGEVDRRDRLAALDAEATSGRCRLRHIGPAWRRETRALDLSALTDLSAAEGGGAPQDVLMRVPWVRQAVIAPMASMLAGNFNRYRE